MAKIKNLPKVIDCDLIRELRLMGRHQEAKELLKAFHKDVKKSGRQAANDYNRKLSRIYKNKGRCPACGRKADEGKILCPICLQNRTKYYTERVNKGICPKCGKKAIVGKVLCENCLQKSQPDEENCLNCKHYMLCDYPSDQEEVWCNKNSNGNLKGFPFLVRLKCYEKNVKKIKKDTGKNNKDMESEIL